MLTKCCYIYQDERDDHLGPSPTPVNQVSTETELAKEQEADVDPHAVTPRSNVNLEATATGNTFSLHAPWIFKNLNAL